jgi:hypothetical protein
MTDGGQSYFPLIRNFNTLGSRANTVDFVLLNSKLSGVKSLVCACRPCSLSFILGRVNSCLYWYSDLAGR